MKSVSDIHFRVIDKGIFLPIARRLARDAARVSYWTPHEEAFESLKKQIGDGFADIERVRSPFENKNDVDCFVFPDIGFPEEQMEFVAQNFPVWGCRFGGEIEECRGRFLSSLSDAGLAVPPHKKIVGMSALRDYLKDKKDKYVKISRYRGDWETLHFKNWSDSETELDVRTLKLGPWKEHLSFFVFDKIETTIEDGCDTYCIDGNFPSLVIHGMEAKDKAYIGAFQQMQDLPKEVRCVNDAFAPILKQFNYRSFFSSEIRITSDGESYFIDPTLRAGSPPSQVMTELMVNLGEIVWNGANGNLIDPVPHKKIGMQARVTLAGDLSGWRTLIIPQELDRWLKCGFCCQIDNRLCFPPIADRGDNDIGWLLGLGDTFTEAIQHLKQNVELLPAGATCEYMALADLIKEIQYAEKEGTEFSDATTPEPEVVIEEEKS